MTETGDLRRAVLTAAYVPEHLPEKVAAAGVEAAAPDDSPARRWFASWGSAPAGSQAAEDVADETR